MECIGRTRSLSILFTVFCFCMTLPRQMIQLNGGEHGDGGFKFEISKHHMLMSSLFYICSMVIMICIAMYSFFCFVFFRIVSQCTDVK